MTLWEWLILLSVLVAVVNKLCLVAIACGKTNQGSEAAISAVLALGLLIAGLILLGLRILP